tara:strand:- start:5642 stop:6343 length:702 start_codon:yes stop_codon:yes gene_type:complete
MTTSGTTAFNLDFAELAEEAFERCGKEMRTGYDLRTARRSFNLMTIELQNRGINMWTIDEGVINLLDGVSTYDLPADTIDLLEHAVRTGSATTQADLTVSRISVSTYATIPTKNTRGRPIQVWIQRLRDNPKITLWPVPDRGTVEAPYYIFKYWRMRRIEDAGTGASTPDVVFRFLPAIAAGLSYYLSMKFPDVDPNRIAMLKADYEQQFDLAGQEDREKAPVRFVPRMFSPR